MERMSQAKGSEIVQKAHGSTRFANGIQNDMLNLLRINYPDMFILKEPHKPKNAFFQLIANAGDN